MDNLEPEGISMPYNYDEFVKDSEKFFKYNPLSMPPIGMDLTEERKKLDKEWRKKQGIYMRKLPGTVFTYHIYSGDYYLYLDGKLQGTFKTFKAMMDFVNE